MPGTAEAPLLLHADESCHVIQINSTKIMQKSVTCLPTTTFSSRSKKIESIPFFSEHNKKRRSLILSWTEQMNSFYMIGTSVMKELNPDSHLWSRLRHKSKHCVNLHEIKKPRVKYEACVETRITKNLNSVQKYPIFMTRFLYIFYIFNPWVPDVH